jgi:hypothetical protein
MKIKPEHYEHIRRAMVPVLKTMPTPQDYAAQPAQEVGLDPAKRHRWDAFRKAGLIPYACGTLYKYADDVHIDNTLKLIVRRFVKEQKS